MQRETEHSDNVSTPCKDEPHCSLAQAAFLIDVFARRIVGWSTSTSLRTKFVLDALGQAIWQRKTTDEKALVHHPGRGSQCLSINYTQCLAEVEIDISVGTVGDACENALAECVIHSGACAAPLMAGRAPAFDSAIW